MLVAWILFILLGAAIAAWASSWLPVAVAGVFVAGFFFLDPYLYPLSCYPL